MNKKIKNDANKKEEVTVKKTQIKYRSYQLKNETIKEKLTKRVETPDITKNIQFYLQ